MPDADGYSMGCGEGANITPIFVHNMNYDSREGWLGGGVMVWLLNYGVQCPMPIGIRWVAEGRAIITHIFVHNMNCDCRECWLGGGMVWWLHFWPSYSALRRNYYVSNSCIIPVKFRFFLVLNIIISDFESLTSNASIHVEIRKYELIWCS